MNEYLDSYLWFRGIGCNHDKASELAGKELKKPKKLYIHT